MQLSEKLGDKQKKVISFSDGKIAPSLTPNPGSTPEIVTKLIKCSSYCDNHEYKAILLL